ncbi:MAG: hypothetical protein LBE37_07890 [Sphingobacterium sp.]|jgi:polygalacturonase|uniref:Glycosyl hydrolase family 28 protein n=1 Tax=Sphingobacterium tabacisoli TaxID=2044855 RepID=A0ABW5KXT3_9SPHI|nr:glycosyl hydrolase family 28 protein [Sphingobacterium tabacisoli]MDR2283113.1 hypothetical protein [Sphingobacterium sp.]
MKIYISAFVFILWSIQVSAQDFNASLFGCKSDGVTNNVGSIQYAIDYIAKKGGGTLHFYVGRYVTSGFSLKSNVHIELHEGAVLVGSSNIYDYQQIDGRYTLISGVGQQNIQIKGLGVIDGQSKALALHVRSLKEKGLLSSEFAMDKVSQLYFSKTSNIAIEGIMQINSLGALNSFVDCQSIKLRKLEINSPQSNAVVLLNSSQVNLSDLFFKSTKQALVQEGTNSNVLKTNCLLANGKSI